MMKKVDNPDEIMEVTILTNGEIVYDDVDPKIRDELEFLL